MNTQEQLRKDLILDTEENDERLKLAIEPEQLLHAIARQLIILTRVTLMDSAPSVVNIVNQNEEEILSSWLDENADLIEKFIKRHNPRLQDVLPADRNPLEDDEVGRDGCSVKEHLEERDKS